MLIAQDSALGKARKSEHRLWRRVAPITTEFAWLPPDVAWSFCSAALYREACREYVAFTEPHVQLTGKAFEAGVVVEDIYYLGDTRSADDLAAFTQMAPERLCLGCGLRVDEPFAPLTVGERPKLFAAACKLLTFVLRDVSAQTNSEEEAALKKPWLHSLPMRISTLLRLLLLWCSPCWRAALIALLVESSGLERLVPRQL